MLFRKKKVNPSPDSEAIRKIVRALPPIRGDVDFINDKQSLAILANLKDIGSNLHDHLKVHYPLIVESIAKELPKDPKRGSAFILTEKQLQGIVARAVIAGATQTAYDIGKNLQLAKELHSLFENSISNDNLEQGNIKGLQADETGEE